jgi:hypothetical protein
LYNLSTDSLNWFVGSEGWEKLGLYEYYRAKNAARKIKDDDILDGLRERSRSPSPIIRLRSRSRSPPKKRYRRYHKTVLCFLPPVSLVTHKVVMLFFLIGGNQKTLSYCAFSCFDCVLMVILIKSHREVSHMLVDN